MITSTRQEWPDHARASAIAELQNIWREVSSLNRFAETKLVLLAGLAAALISALHARDQLGALQAALGFGNPQIQYIAYGLAFVISASQIFPRLNGARLKMFRKADHEKGLNLYFFSDIARFESSGAWLGRLKLQMTDAERERAVQLAEQVFIVSRIARVKFEAFKLATYLLFGGYVVAVVAMRLGL